MAKKKKKKSAARVPKPQQGPAAAVENTAATSDEYGEAQARTDAALASLDEDERAEIIAAPDVRVPHSPDFSEEDFRSSVMELKAESIESIAETETDTDTKKSPAAPKKKKQSTSARFIQTAVLGVCAVVFVFCMVLLVKNIKGKIDGEKIYSDAEFDHFTINDNSDSFNHPSSLPMISSDARMLSLFERIAAGKSEENTKSGEYAEKIAAMKASLTALKAKNKDVYGWIYAENTTIDHPVMRGSDNDYYLDHAYTGEALPIGSIFLDYNTADKLDDNYNAVLYGHNVVAVAGSKSAMFHDVTKFLDEDFFRQNKIYIYTMDGVYIYKAVSVYPTTAEYFYYRCEFPNEASFLKFANEVVGNSKVTSGESFAEGDKMITLSTCTNGTDTGRYALHAKLIEVIR